MDRIILIAQQLSKEGKVPTTALIKSRLPKTVPLPAIIQGLKMWKENPHKEIDCASPPNLDGSPSNQGVDSFDALLDAKIKQAIAPLITQINTLKAEISDLRKQFTTEDKN
ncbi:MAG: hypothetical protein OQK77_10415 [Psychromonas sp.]|nr:hypothetical protein [Psychromonas sp.]